MINTNVSIVLVDVIAITAITLLSKHRFSELSYEKQWPFAFIASHVII